MLSANQRNRLITNEFDSMDGDLVITSMDHRLSTASYFKLLIALSNAGLRMKTLVTWGKKVKFNKPFSRSISCGETREPRTDKAHHKADYFFSLFLVKCL